MKPEEWTPGHRAWLSVHMERIKATRVFEDLENGRLDLLSLSPQRIYEVVFLATDNQRLADSYRIAALQARQKPAGNDTDGL